MDAWVFGGGGDHKDKPDKKRPSSSVEKSGDSRKGKKQRVVGETDGREEGDDNCVMTRVLAAEVPQFAVGFEVESLDSRAQHNQGGISLATAKEEEDEEESISNFMRSLDSLRQGVEASNPSLSLPLPTQEQLTSWVPDSIRNAEQSVSEPLRLRLRQLRTGTSTITSGRETSVSWSTQQDGDRQSIPSLPTFSSATTSSTGDLMALNDRVDALQTMMEKFISVVSPWFKQINKTVTED